ENHPLGDAFPLTYWGRFVVLWHCEKSTWVDCFLCSFTMLYAMQNYETDELHAGAFHSSFTR
ncbi:hypothetical protein, partial [Rosenbergiella collisarenosi]|uniref:hypothetical protein n=1 Tax=Rosenbergiella collisarenosi TaxID=1544695 RepID=UPI001BDB0ACA